MLGNLALLVAKIETWGFLPFQFLGNLLRAFIKGFKY